MRICVEISAWEQACCGEAFNIGGEATWKLLAAEPGIPANNEARAGILMFNEEHHEPPEGAEHLAVSGLVREISGLVHPAVPIAGEPGSFTIAEDEPELTPLQRVEAQSESGEFTGYRVELEVPDDCVLPQFALTASMIEDRAAEARESRLNRELMADEVGRILEASADSAEREYSGVATILRAHGRSAITITPRNERGTLVAWARYAPDEDEWDDADEAEWEDADAGEWDDADDGETSESQIGIHIGYGSWWLPATVEHALLVADLLGAAAQGRVVEDVVDLGESGKRLDTRVELSRDRDWVASEELPELTRHAEMVFLAGNTAERLDRGPFRYAAWAEKP